jgi:hypothetical protein
MPFPLLTRPESLHQQYDIREHLSMNEQAAVAPRCVISRVAALFFVEHLPTGSGCAPLRAASPTNPAQATTDTTLTVFNGSPFTSATD